MAHLVKNVHSILTERRNSVRLVTLNRPQALNALNHEMVKTLYPLYKEWDLSEEDKIIVLKGTGEKAFCAGGDIRSIYDMGGISTRHHPLPSTSGQHHHHQENHHHGHHQHDTHHSTRHHGTKEHHHHQHESNFFHDEYLLNYRIANLKTPHVSLISGITMGGGLGLSVHGTYRVATDSSMVAMPETGIGFFCDVGGSHFLGKMKGGLGMYLALTGARLKAFDVYASGIATHFVKSEKWADFEKDLLNVKTPNDLPQLLDSYHFTQGESKIPEDQIDKHFGPQHQSIFDIIASLNEDSQNTFSSQTLSSLRAHSPSSLRVVFRQLQIGKKMSKSWDLGDALKMEYRLAIHFMRKKDFFEGVRALLVDKDKNPQWNPSSLEDISEEEVNSYFANVGEDELHVVP